MKGKVREILEGASLLGLMFSLLLVDSCPLITLVLLVLCGTSAILLEQGII